MTHCFFCNCFHGVVFSSGWLWGVFTVPVSVQVHILCVIQPNAAVNLLIQVILYFYFLPICFQHTYTFDYAPLAVFFSPSNLHLSCFSSILPISSSLLYYLMIRGVIAQLKWISRLGLITYPSKDLFFLFFPFSPPWLCIRCSFL